MSFDLSELDSIYSAGRTIVYRGAHMPSGAAVVLKTLRATFPSAAALRALRHEHRLLSALESPGIVRTHGLFEQDGVLILAVEDFGGISLADACKRRRLTMEAFFDVAVSLAEAVQEIHAADIIHRDLSPGNVVWNAESGLVKVVDFGLSSRGAEGRVQAGQLHGTLTTIAPEQTGRTQRRIDRRTDLYSMGCTLYQALLGRPPFEIEDPVELVHAHLAQRPTPPSEVDPAVPEMLSHILMKLLEKDGADRYQSARGLVADLRRVRDAWLADGSCPAFPSRRTTRTRCGYRTDSTGATTSFASCENGWKMLRAGSLSGRDRGLLRHR